MALKPEPHVIRAAPGYRGRYMTVVLGEPDVTLDKLSRMICFATGCSAEEAYIEAWEAEHLGRAEVYFSNQENCCAVASILSSIGVQTEVRPEWQ
ncbi:MAG: hypothetical protein C4340_07210 [Armatimonadota bacterium]